MKKILVPTDFSNLSKAAAYYAIGIARDIDAEIILLHTINGGASPNALKNWEKLENSMINAAQNEADTMLSEIKISEGFNNISYSHALGFPIKDVIAQFVMDNQIDLIVMGTTGASGLKKLIGSNTTSVMENSNVPVLVVPQLAHYRHIKEILYASDMHNLSGEIKIVVRLARLLEAHVNVVHGIKDDLDKNVQLLENAAIRSDKKDELIRTMDYPNIRLHVFRNESVVALIDDFLGLQKIDLVIMFSGELGFGDKLFQRSETRKLAFHNEIPLLIYKKETRK
ncbi:universal stress protein [soil metagenome]